MVAVVADGLGDDVAVAVDEHALARGHVTRGHREVGRLLARDVAVRRAAADAEHVGHPGIPAHSQRPLVLALDVAAVGRDVAGDRAHRGELTAPWSRRTSLGRACRRHGPRSRPPCPGAARSPGSGRRCAGCRADDLLGLGTDLPDQLGRRSRIRRRSSLARRCCAAPARSWPSAGSPAGRSGCPRTGRSGRASCAPAVHRALGELRTSREASSGLPVMDARGPPRPGAAPRWAMSPRWTMTWATTCRCARGRPPIIQLARVAACRSGSARRGGRCPAAGGDHVRSASCADQPGLLPPACRVPGVVARLRIRLGRVLVHRPAADPALVNRPCSSRGCLRLNWVSSQPESDFSRTDPGLQVARGLGGIHRGPPRIDLPTWSRSRRLRDLARMSACS